MTCSALKLNNIDTVWGMVVDYYFQAQEQKAFQKKRTQQNRDWMHELVKEMLMLKLTQNPEVKALIPTLEQKVADNDTTAYAAARQIMERLGF